MKKKLPISIEKYNTHVAKFGRSIFGDRRKNYVMSSPRFYANRFDASSALYRGLDRYDYNHFTQKVTMNNVFDFLTKFINLPEMPKTYLSRRKSNDYTVNRYSTKNAYFDFDVETLNYIADNHRQSYEQALALPENKGSFHNYMFRDILRRESINYSMNVREHLDFENNKILGPLKFNLNDLNSIEALKENLLNIKLENLLNFTIEAAKEVCVSKFNDASFAEKENYYRPDMWYDRGKETKEFLANYLYPASRNAIIVQVSYEIILRTINFKYFKHNIPLPEKPKTEYAPLNYLSLAYYFYEVVDFKEYI